MALNSEQKLENYRKICSRATLQDQKEGFFFSLAEALSEKIDLRTFEKFTTDLDRVKYVTKVCWNSIGAELIFRGKKLEEAVKRTKEGDEFFRKKEYHRAMVNYCQGLIQAPVGPELVELYSKRSALFQAMGDYHHSITDCELAIAYGAPEETRHNLYERLATCYLETKNYHKAKVILRLAKHFAEKFAKDDSKLEQRLDNLGKSIESSMKSNKQSKDPSATSEGNTLVPKFKSGKKFKNASSKFDVKYSAGLGRYAYAKKAISVGDEILREKPFAAILSLNRMGTHCLHCLERLKAPVPCETCANVVFCSRECKKAGDFYHQYECRVMSMLLGSGMSANCYLALRMVTQTSIEDWLKIIPHLNIDPQTVVSKLDGTFDTSYLSIYNLGGLEDRRPVEEMLHRTIMAVFLTKCLRLMGYFNVNLFMNPSPSSNEFHIAALILRNLQVLQFNAYEICEFVMPEKTNYGKSRAASIGLGIYPTSSFFNHSCSPDVTRYFSDKTLIVTAVRNIAVNCPIYDNYGPQFIRTGRDDRRLQLNGRYWFYCLCEACENDWNTLPNLMVEIEPKSPEEEKALTKLQDLESVFDHATKAMGAGLPEKAIELLIQYKKEAEAVLSPHKTASFYPYKTIVLAEQALQLCYCSLGSVYLAPISGSESKP